MVSSVDSPPCHIAPVSIGRTESFPELVFEQE